MKKHLYLLATVGVLSLTSCGTKHYKYSRCKHAEYDGYTCNFYNEDTGKWEEETGLTWAESYDKMLDLSKTTKHEIRTEYLHQCEDLIMESGAVCPLYFYSDVYLLNPKIKGLMVCSVGFKMFNHCYNDDHTLKELDVCVGAKADCLDPAKNSTIDGGVVCLHNFEGLYKWKKAENEGEVSREVEEGVAESISEPVLDKDGKATYTIKLKSGDKSSRWSDDGKDVTATDFIYSWNRAANGKLSSDYAYMFEYIDGYEEVSTDTTGTVTFSGLKKGDDDYTILLTTISEVPYIKELLAFPCYLPVKKSVVEKTEDNSWWTSPDTYIGNGPMKCEEIKNVEGGYFKFSRNPYYRNPGDIETLTFKLSSDDDNQFTSYETRLKGGTGLDFIDSISQGHISTVKSDPSYWGYYCADQIGTYYINFNVNDTVLNDFLQTEEEYAQFRNALSLLIDRNYICEEIGKAEQKPANGFVGDGAVQQGIGGVAEEWKDHRGPDRNGDGYYSVKKEDYTNNCIKAVMMLKELGFNWDENTQKFTNIPTITYLYNSGSGHKLIGEYLSGQFYAYGIKLKLDSQEWAVFLNTRKSGDFTLARNGWVADLTDATSFLDMWKTESGNNDVQFGR